MSLSSFLETLGRGGSRQQTYAVDVVEGLSPLEKGQAVQALLERVEVHQDIRAALSLSALGVVVAAPAIEVLMKRRVGDADRAMLAGALATLEPESPSAIADLVVALTTSVSRVARLQAARSLEAHPCPAAQQALVSALSDEDRLVRAAAVHALVAHAGYLDFLDPKDEAREIRSPLNVLKLRILCSLETVAGPARRRLIKMVTSTGTNAEELGIPYVPSNPPVDDRAIGRNVAKRSEPLDIPRLLALRGHDRSWVESLLLIRLAPTKSDVRAPAALLSLGVAEAQAAFDEALAVGATEAMRNAIAEARAQHA